MNNIYYGKTDATDTFVALTERIEALEAENEQLRIKIRLHEIAWKCERCTGVVDGVPVDCNADSCEIAKEERELKAKESENTEKKPDIFDKKIVLTDDGARRFINILKAKEDEA